MRRPRLLLVQFALIVALLLPLLPPAVVRAEEQPIPQQTEPEPPSDLVEPVAPEILVPPLEESHLPSLAMRLQVVPEDWVRVGDLITATLTLWNQAPDPAEELVVSLPLPAEAAPVDTADSALSAAGWRWELGSLSGGEQTTVTATLRLTQVPPGEALLLRPEASARGLELPIVAVGGALVSSEPVIVTPRAVLPAESDSPVIEPALSETTDAVTNAAAPTESDSPVIEPALSETTDAVTNAAAPAANQNGKGKSRFTPGRVTRLESRDGRVAVDVPANAFDASLNLEFLSPAEALPRLRARGQEAPPAIAGYRRGFGTFFLEARDDQGKDIHQFKAPLTVTIRITPQQLEVLDIAPDDLTVFWFDEQRLNKDAKGQERKGQWVPLRTVVDLAAGTATFTVDHFSGFQLSDGSSPSAAYLPSLQGWQVSQLTGAATFTYPIEVPAGPNGIKPDLSLSYSSAATDGVGGMRKTAQASWVGKGWTLDTGSVALNKIEVSSGTTVNHYALSFNGRSYDLVRAEALVSSPDPNNPTHWVWRPTDESFIKVRVVQNGVSAPGSSGAPGIGASDYGTPLPRYKWVVWDKSGTRFEFAEDLWWAWANCSGSGAFSYFENNRWLLKSVTDTANNTITYSYNRSKAYYSTCMGKAGTVDFDVWPTEISWAGGRYKVVFVSDARTNDTQFDWPAYVVGGPVRETRRLTAIKVMSQQASTWELVREYRFGYDYSLYSDARRCAAGNCPLGSGWSAETGYPKLTLKSIQRIGSNGTTGLPLTTFSYNTNGGGAFDAAGGWNRLTGMNNGQGGTLSIQYENIAAAVAGDDHFRNRHRVTTKTQTDGRGNSYTWSYTYVGPLVNTIGSNLGDSIAGSVHPTSASLYYNIFLDGDADDDQAGWLVHRQWQEFLGHSTVTETDPSGAQTRRSFIQSANCTPAASAKGSHAAIIGDSCFQSMLLYELVKGREWRSEQLSSSGAKLAETIQTWKHGPVDYTWAPLSGLWRAFRYQAAVDESMFEGGSTANTRRTEYYYNSSCSASSIDTYGNLGCVVEKDRGTLVRVTLHAYGTRDTATEYIVDRNIATTILDNLPGSGGRYLAHSQRFYDTNNQALGTIGTKGQLTREIQIYDVPLSTNITNVQLNGRDTTYGYDSWGNQTTVSTYDGPGWVKWTGSAWTASSPGAGTTARTTTIAYDGVFHALPRAITNPLGHAERAEYDLRMGTLIKVDGPNGNANGDPVDCANLFASNSSTAISHDVSCASYDVFGRMRKLVRPGDSALYPTVVADYYDSEIPFRYVVQQREQAGTANTRYTRLYYDGLGRQILTKVELKGSAPYRSAATFSVYDGLGRMTQQSQPIEVTESDQSAFFGYTNPASLSGIRWTTTTYDGLGRPLTVTAPDNTTTNYRYFVNGGQRMRDTIDAKRHLTRHRYDSLGRLLRTEEWNGNCTSGYAGFTCGGQYTTNWTLYADTDYTYTPLDLLSTVVDAKDNTTTLSYDSLGRKTRTVDRDMGTWYYNYDANGNLVTQTDANQRVTIYNYDKLDRLISRMAQGSGPTTSFLDSFDGTSLNLSHWGASGHQTVADGMITNTGTGSDWSASFARSAYSLTTGDGIFVRFKVNVTSPDAIFAVETGSGSSYRRFGLRATNSQLYLQYTKDGSTYISTPLLSPLKTGVWYRLNITLDDIAGFRLHVAEENAAQTRATVQLAMPTGQSWRFHHWTYSGVATLDTYNEYFGPKYTYDAGTNGVGQRTAMTLHTPEVGTLASTSWAYDTRGRTTGATHHVKGLSGGRTFTWTYDSADRVVTQLFPAAGSAAAETLTYSYDSGWRQTQVCTSLGGCYAQGAAYEVSGQLDHLTLGNSLVQNWMYDSLNRPVRLQLGTSGSVNTADNLNAGAADRFDRHYAYDAVGNITTLTDKRGVVAQQSYSYDDRDRLTGWTLGSTSQSYAYDTIGNLTQKAGVVQSYGSNGNGTGSGPHQVRNVGGSTYTYDANGNLLSGGGRSYVWTPWHQPLSVTSAGVTETYLYNGDGARVKKTRGSNSTFYLEGSWEEDSTGVVRKYYTLAGQTVAMREISSSSNTVTYLQSDHLGSVSLTTNNSGVAGTSQEFDPWGKVRSGGISQTKRNYTGQYLDETGLLFYNARYYDPNIGRFLSADTIVPGSNPLTVWPSDSVASGAWGTSGSAPANPQELNRYSYGLNNPVRNTDPTGHCPMCIGAVAGALIGAGVAYGAQVYSNYQSGMDLGQAMTTDINVAAIAAGAVAGAVIGGTLGVAAAPGGIAGYTVSSGLQLGTVGAATNVAGNVIGQALTSDSINPTDVAVAGVVGFAAGAASPIVASTAIGSMAAGYVAPVGVGAVANTAQYVATQSIKSESITPQGAAINAFTGAVAGGLGGPISKLSGFSLLKPSLQSQELMRASVTRSSLVRGVLGGVYSNANWQPRSNAR